MRQRGASSPDVIVAGAGPVGLAVAALLASRPAAKRLEIHVVDAGPRAEWRQDRIDPRVYALSRASQRVLMQAGAWEWLAGRRLCPYRRMRIWQGERWGASGSLEFDSADIGEPDLGHIVEDSLIRAALTEALAAAANVHLLMSTPVDSVRFDRDAVAVELGTGRVLRGSVLIAADGAESPIRKMVGIRYLGRDYGQQALVSHVATELPHEEIAWQRFLEGGPLAFLPLSDGRSSIVWSLPNSDAQELIAASDGRFLEALQVASGGVLGSIEAVGERALFRLKARHALRYTRPRLALAGDAAHSVHPLAGQGMNLGLLDADLLAAVIGRAAECGEDPGDLRTIRRYERGRKADNLGMLLALDAIDLTFRMPRWFTPFSAAGLEVVDRSGLAKEVLMRHALGVSGLGRHAA